MSKWYVGNEFSGGSVYHFGILGMKWGVRKYQNSDGSLTPAGKERYSKPKSKNAIKKVIQEYKDMLGAKNLIRNEKSMKVDINKYNKGVQKYYWALKNPKKKPKGMPEAFWKEIQKTRRALLRLNISKAIVMGNVGALNQQLNQQMLLEQTLRNQINTQNIINNNMWMMQTSHQAW